MKNRSPETAVLSVLRSSFLEKILFVFDLVHEPGDVLPRFFAERRADDLDDLTRRDGPDRAALAQRKSVAESRKESRGVEVAPRPSCPRAWLRP